MKRANGKAATGWHREAARNYKLRPQFKRIARPVKREFFNRHASLEIDRLTLRVEQLEAENRRLSLLVVADTIEAWERDHA